MCPGRAGRHGHPIRGDAFPNSLAVGPAGIQLAAEDPLTFEQLIAKRQRGGLHEPAPGSPLVATAETAVYLTTDGVMAYRLRTG